jgi:putative membrane-bound dehydrogenase-like protein
MANGVGGSHRPGRGKVLALRLCLLVTLVLAGLAIRLAWTKEAKAARVISCNIAAQSKGADARPSELPFTVPAGFVAERVAGSPLLTHPMFASFDEQGRLYVASSSGHSLGPDALAKNPSDEIRCLEDTDGDGRFDKSTVFADKLTFPQGVLYHDGAVYTASPPSLWRLEDTDGDGVADLREELVTGFPFTGIADDLHGPCLGPDGRIYWGVGRFDYQIHVPGGPVLRKGKTPLIMRCQPNGADVEVVCGAMGNPVEVAFTAEGEPMACGTFLAPESMGQGLRDAIVHCVPGALYPVRDRDLNEDKRTGDPLPPVAHLGVAAASGVTRARGGPLGAEDQVVLYSALFNMHKVERHWLERDGATYRAKNEDFLVSTDPDFHPTDVLEDADGSLLVVDTGAWFTHCPTSQIARSNVMGAIYRVRRQSAEKLKDPRGLNLDWSTFDPKALAVRLDDPRFAVRDRAVRALAKQGIGVLPVLHDVLAGGDTPRVRRNAVWALCRIQGSKARAATLPALDDPSMSVRLAAAAAVGLHHDASPVPRLLKMVQSDAPPVRREAASALARIRAQGVVATLLNGLRSSTDRFLDHALIYALITLADPAATLPGLTDASAAVRRGALIALDQMEGGRLNAAQVIPCLDPAEPALQQAALHVIARHPAWAADMVAPFRRALLHKLPPPPASEGLRQTLLAYGADPGVQKLFTALLRDESTPVESELLLLETLGQMSFDNRPAWLVDPLNHALEARDERVVRQAVATVRSIGQGAFDSALLDLAHQPSRSTELRVEALEAVAPRLESLEPSLFDFLTSVLHPDTLPLLRLQAARALAEAQLDARQLESLIGKVADSGALILPRLLPAFAHSHDSRIGTLLLGALDRSPALRSLTPETLRRVLENYSEEVQQQAQPLFKRLEALESDQAARLAALRPLLARGDTRQGREVFFGTRATCSTCHTVFTEGGHVGPDLSKIGAVRTGRDLLEAIVFPSASFARGFEPYVVATHDGRVFHGLIARETADAIYLVSPTRAEIPLPRSSIEAIEQSRTSIMPQGLEANLTQQDLADLVAFLASLK